MGKYYRENYECMRQEEKHELQIALLNKTLRNLRENSKFYREKYSNYIKEVTHLPDLSEFPLTTKQELLGLGKYDNLCVNLKDVVEVHFSSGTTNKPIPSFLTEEDLSHSSECLASTWYMQGIRKESIFAMLASYGLFSAGLLNHYSIQKIGAFVIPISAITTAKALDIIKNYNVDSMAAVASYYLYIIEEMDRLGMTNLNVKRAIAGGEPFTEKQREHIENKLNLKLYDQYGLCEINTGLAGECKYKEGLHLLDFYAYPEIINPETGEILEEGEEGELVLSTLLKTASPLLRYRTGDLTSITYKKCQCGRTTPRISRIKKRIQKTYYFKGIKIDTEEIKLFMEKQSALINPYIWNLELSGDIKKQKIVLNVIPKTKHQKELQAISNYFKNQYNIKIEINNMSKKEIDLSIKTKKKQFIDMRKKI